ASKLYSGSGQGFLMDIVLGIVGAVLGGYLFTAIGATGITGFNLYSMFV
ncbi:MAG TPA: GlsB/YeaQ/YmgE family stress response membrane protein, partial [Rhizobiales bacterium]|nr:GlsB/YeaQ/YmgE family stress response membrane protein [Hyphomicrobiales bacterium]